MTSGTQNLVIPQFGTSTNPNVSTFTGYSVTQSYSVSIDHQFTSLIFVGHAFGPGFLYVGGGPSVSQIKVKLDNVVGYATINGVLTDISGAPQSFASTDWRVGPAATAGFTYFLTPSLFIDARYLFTAPSSRTVFITSPFDNPGNPTTFKGTLIGTATANVRNTQAVSITLNKVF
jgi:opacity protein-like surface antigen